MKKCKWQYNMNNTSMGRVATTGCCSYTYHGSLVTTVRDVFKYCPHCGLEIELKESK